MKNKGFTLVELLAVIAILAILVIIALPNVLKMFNDAKKNSFLTEAKTIYSEVSKKYISESMKGNKLTYVSSEDDTKLDMTGKKLQYCVLLNADGSVKSMKVLNGEWIVELPSGKKITDLKSSDLKDVPSGYKFECNGSTSQTPQPSKSFAEDSWDTIKSNVKAGSTSNYHVGDEKDVNLGNTYGTHKVRISNMSTPDECKQNGFSQSACGFVVEFTDIITAYDMNPTHTNEGGWPASKMYKFLNDKNDSNSIINLLPNDLKSIIIDTKTVSGHGELDPENHISMDKLYLLATAEVWKDGDQADTARDKTRQLDYYNSKGVTTSSYAAAIKKDSTGTAAEWWLRGASSDFDFSFYYLFNTGAGSDVNADYLSGVSPAFRIG